MDAWEPVRDERTEFARGLRESAGSHNLPPGTKPMHLATEVFVHTGDIRRPSGDGVATLTARLRA